MYKNKYIFVHAGSHCTPNYIIRSILSLDFESPFMLMMIPLENIIDIINNNFVDYLNKDYYYVDDKRKTEIKHEKYGLIWNHLNPMLDQGYDKLKKRVNNLLKYLHLSEQKIFVYIHIPYEINCMEDLINNGNLLLNSSSKLYPHHIFKLFIFSNLINNDIYNDNSDIFFIKTDYQWNIWDIKSKEEQQKAIDNLEINLFKTLDKI